jgi:anhydro-N-acetylmuramic acid kinase
VLVLGVNTGTSVDGVDLALVDWDINDLSKFEIIKESSYEFDPSVKKDIEVLIGLQRGTLEEISNLNYKFSQFVASLIIDFKNETDEKIDLLGIHGQTIFHGPLSSFQLINASVVAKLTGITCVADFRSADIAVGGCGAPLTSFLDDKVIRINSETRATLNLGGIANISVLEPNKPTFAYDTGPANTLIDVLMKKLFKQDFDKDGRVAFEGKVDDRFVDNLIRRTDYFQLTPPKATGRELFDEKFADKFLDLGNKENIIATASYFTVKTIDNELKKYPIKTIFTSGGGTSNKFIMTKLKEANPSIHFSDHSSFGIKSQYKEAILFSLLAYTSINKIPNNIPSSTGAKKAVVLGVIAHPY